MHWLRSGIIFLLAGVCLAADTATPATGTAAPAAQPSCSGSPSPDCAAPVVPPTPTVPSRQDLKSAKHAFANGLKLEQSRNLDEAFRQFEEAARLSPFNPTYLTAREMTREYLAGEHLERGNASLLAGRRDEALTEFRAALRLDPQNEFAQQRVQDAIGPPPHTLAAMQVVARSDTLALNPAGGLSGLHDIHYRGDSKGMITAVAASFGLTVVFDDTFVSRHVRFDIDQADFATVMRAASKVTKTMIVPLDSTVLLAAADTPENHQAYDHMGMRTFFLPGTGSLSDLNEIMAAVRGLFDFRFVTLSASSTTITVRGPIATLEGATRFLSQFESSSAEPLVLLDVQVLEVSHNYARNIGLHVPDQFNLFNIPASALAAVAGQNLQTLVNQLISSGGINQAGNTSISALLAQLQGQQNSIFSQPLATFGGGLTLEGLSLDHLAAVLSLNESSVRSVDHVQLLAAQGKDATFRLGSRFPVLNASFSPISNSSAVAGVLQNQSYAAPFPSVNYEDIGLTVKAKPTIHRNADVALELTIQLRGIGGTTVNSVPIITNREFVGGIALKEGDIAAVAGMVSDSDQRSLNGLPTFANIPGFGLFVSQNSRMKNEDELLILMTPHVLRESTHPDTPLIWFSR